MFLLTQAKRRKALDELHIIGLIRARRSIEAGGNGRVAVNALSVASYLVRSSLHLILPTAIAVIIGNRLAISPEMVMFGEALAYLMVCLVVVAPILVGLSVALWFRMKAREPLP